MERDWTYIDDSGAEYGPYTREELELYAQQGRVSATGSVRNAVGETMSPEEAGLEVTEVRTSEAQRAHPATDATEASVEADRGREGTLSPHTRSSYVLLGILLPWFGGIAGVNNLMVGRTSTGTTQLVLGLTAMLLNILGAFVGVTCCIGIPLWLGILIWSIVEAATNTEDGEGRTFA